jgi:hypothetical protein
MRLLPMKEPDRSWRTIKAQWKKDAESVGEDFSTFSTGSFTTYDGLTKDGDNPNLYCLSDGERVHAACQVSRDDEQISRAHPAHTLYRRVPGL